MSSKKFLVIDIGGTKIRSALWSDHTLSHIESIVTPRGSVEQFFNELNTHILKRRNEFSFEAVGVSSAGPIDVKNGVILNPANLGDGSPQWRRVELKKNILPDLALPITVDNDAALTAFGHYHHVEKAACRDLVLVTLGTGVGVGAIVDGELSRSGQNMHPELGHMLLGVQVDENYQSPMGGVPTLESYASGSHFAKRLSLKYNENWRGEDLLELSRQGDTRLLLEWKTYAQRLASGLANLYLMYFPEKIILAGGFARGASEFFKEDCASWLKKILVEREKAGMIVPSIEVSPLYNELPLLGAGYQIEKATSE